MNPQSNSFMYFYEIAAIFGVSEKTFRKLLKAHSNPEIQKLGNKRGSGSYFYKEDEIQLILSEIKK